MYFQFANVLVFALLALALCGIMVGLEKLLAPSNPHPAKLTTYECGEPPSGGAWINFNIRFYLIALVFVIFDVELAFVYPVVTVFRSWIARGAGVAALVEIGLFVGILAVGLVYVWVKGDLEWLKRLPGEGDEEPSARRAA
ncbi:MAG TPA: NADH-quinone oxidoreductase subunit A [Candidatus Binatia bacterium]|nr:NADH-quinone oxidoreductase subunit A [Candidatus Binatia bacterium]